MAHSGRAACSCRQARQEGSVELLGVELAGELRAGQKACRDRQVLLPNNPCLDSCQLSSGGQLRGDQGGGGGGRDQAFYHKKISNLRGCSGEGGRERG